MKNVLGNELLSAYLDGELSAAEQAEVERLLAENAHARQLLDELRALSTSLQELPQYKLEEDFPERVLRAAERRILTDEHLARPAELKRRSVVRRFLTPRAVIWSGLAVAVAVALMVLGLDELKQPDDDEVAKAPAPAAAPAPAKDFVPPTIRAARKEGEVAGEADEEMFADRLARAKTPAASEVAKSGELAMKKPSAATLMVDQPAQKVVPPTANGRKIAAKGGPIPRKGGAKIAAKGGRPPAGKAVARLKTEHGILGGLAGREAGGSAKTAPRHIVEGVPADHAAPVAPIPAGVLLVQCDVSPEAVRQRSFDKLLLSNGIAWEEDESHRGAAPAKETWANAVRRPSLDQKLADVESQVSAARRDAQQGPGALDVVYVEATPEQIEATLSQLAAQPRQFLSVFVEPAPDVAWQRPLSRFNRRGVPAPTTPKSEPARAAKARAVQGDAAAGVDSLRAQVQRSGRDRVMSRQTAQPGRARRVQLPGASLDVAGQVEGLRHRKSGLGDQRPAPRDAETLAEKSDRDKQEAEQKAAREEAPAEPREPFAGRPKAPAERLQSASEGSQQPPDARQQFRPSQEYRRPQQLATYRALFVLRMVEPQMPAGAGAAAAAMEEADAEKPADVNATETQK